jgi:hypothetical protein
MLMYPFLLSPRSGSMWRSLHQTSEVREISPMARALPLPISYRPRIGWVAVLLLLLATPGSVYAQLDPIQRSLLQIGYDQPINGRGPQSGYAYYYYNNPAIAGTNVLLRLAVAPIYLDGELGFRSLLSAHTDVGIGISGGGYGDNYYEVRQGNYHREESFDGHGGGLALGIYQLLNPSMRIPLSLVMKGGGRYSVFNRTGRTADTFEPPDDRFMPFVRAGLRFAGKEPVLYPDLGLELSVWFERQWRSSDGQYGFLGDRRVNSRVDLYWAYAGLDYAWTNTGHKASLAVTAGGSGDADRLGAWRLGGVLPLVAEFPLIIPGYYHQELTARRFTHFSASYLIPLDGTGRLQLRLEGAAAYLDELEGFEQPDSWQSGVGGGLTYTPKSKSYRIVARYGYGINAVREHRTEKGGHSVGLLVQYDFEQARNAH